MSPPISDGENDRDEETDPTRTPEVGGTGGNDSRRQDNRPNDAGNSGELTETDSGLTSPSALVDRPVNEPANGSREAENDAELVELWLEKHASEATREAYRRDIEQFVEYVDLPLRRVVLRDVQAWKRELDSRDFKPATQARKLAAVKSIYTFAETIGFVKFNVAAAVKLPEVPNRTSERRLSQQEVSQVIGAAATMTEKNRNRNQLLILVLYASGGRVSEVSELQWRSIQPRTIPANDTDEETAYLETGQIVFESTKSGKTRAVVVSPQTWRAIEQFHEIEAAAGYGGNQDHVFRSREGGGLSRQRIWQIIKDAAMHAGVNEDVSPHWFRHSHATHARASGEQLDVISSTLGHADPSITASIYVDLAVEKSSALALDV